MYNVWKKRDFCQNLDTVGYYVLITFRASNLYLEIFILHNLERNRSIYGTFWSTQGTIHIFH